jgi:tRNA(Ile)-lysidine synthase
MKGKTKNVSNFLNDLKIPLNIKQQVQVLTADEKIAWVIGYQIDERFKVTEKTKTIIEICKC